MHGTTRGNVAQNEQTGVNIVVFVARALACPLEVCLRKNFGQNYLGLHSLAGLFSIPLWMGFFPSEHYRELGWFWWLVVAMLIRARLETLRRERRGVFLHTRYNGWPRLAAIFRRLPEDKIKGVIEPLAGLGLGIALAAFSDMLACYLMISAVALWFVQATIDAVDRVRTLQMNDAFIDQLAMAERFRTMQRGARR